MGLQSEDSLPGDFYKTIVSIMQEGIWVTDRSDRIIFFNASMEAISGVKSSDVLGLRVLTDFPEETTKCFRSFYLEARETMKPVEYTAEVTTPTGRKTVQSGWCIPLVNDSRYDGIICTIQDVTEKKKTEEALRKSEERLQLILRGSHDAPWDWDLEKNEIYYSSQWYEQLGFSSGAGSSDPALWRNLLHPEDRERVMNFYDENLNGSIESFHLEFRLQHCRGHYITVLCKGYITRNSRGKALRISGTNMDMSERRRVQEELQKTQRLESLGILAGGIAHDFNNLLGGIFGNIDLAREVIADNPEGLKYLNRAIGTMERARSLTEQLLTFSKGGAPRKTTLQISGLVEESYFLTLGGSNISCQMNFAPDLKPVQADGSQMSQVINNILLNARQAMPGGGLIWVSGENLNLTSESVPGLAAGDYVRLEVRDQGEGIPEELLSKVFDPFFTTRSEGIGLGLAMCHSIVRKHNGAILIDSLPNEGTAVSIYLPVATADNTESVFEIR